MTRGARLSVACVLALLGAMLGQNTAYQPDPGWRAPDVAASKPNPLARRPEAAAGGKKLFLRNRTECHGSDGGGINQETRSRLAASGGAGAERWCPVLEDYQRESRPRHTVLQQTAGAAKMATGALSADVEEGGRAAVMF